MKVFFAQRGNCYDEDDKRAILELLDQPVTFNKWDAIKRFEKEFKDYIGAGFALSTTSCTSALHLALRGVDLRPGDEVITTPMTWVATSNVIMLEGAKPVFVDVEPDTLNIDPDKIRAKITNKTKAILPVHYSGHPADMDKIQAIAKEFSLFVISDAAHAIGAEYKSKRIGSFEDLAAYSFYTQKNMSTLGEGGMVTTNQEDVIERIKLYQNHGVKYVNNYVGSAKLEEPWYRDCVMVGNNYRMSEGQAVIGSVQLKKVDKFNAKRRQIAEYYSKLLKDISGIITPIEKDYAKSSWHFYVIKIEDSFGLNRNEVYHRLKELGVETSVHYTPLTHFIPYQALGYNVNDFPIAEAAYKKILSLPLHVKMDEAQVEYVVEMLKTIKK